MAENTEALRRRIAELTAEIRLLRQQFEAEVGRSSISVRAEEEVTSNAASGARRKRPTRLAKGPRLQQS